MEQERETTLIPCRHKGLLALLALLPVACMLLDSAQEKAPPQGWLKSRGPVVPHDSFPSDCTLCHVGKGWYQIREDFQFDHDKETGVALVGAHKHAECLRCHNDRGPVAQFAARGCRGCHEDWHRAQMGANCQDCHNEVNWVPKEQILRHNRTRFPLVGAHAGIACWRCHEGAQVGNFLHASTKCETCHQQDLAQALSPNHIQMGWTRDCRRCHVPVAWTGPGFVHRSFPLAGKHAVTECTKCHQGGTFRGTPRRCEDCHQADLARALNPNHAATGWTSGCERCHVPSGWTGANFLHTTYPLTGAHAGADCAKCHAGNVFKGTPRICSGCHLDDYNATTSPNHQASSFPTTCESCHNTTRWQGAVFNHRFPLQGPHDQTCSRCHTTPNFKVYSCLSCHEHRQSEMDNEHEEVRGYTYTSTACVQCHPNGR